MQANSFRGERLQLAREFRGLTQTALGSSVATSATLISLIETNKKVEQPTRDLVEAFAEVLGFQTDFFYRPVDDPFKESECNFRHRRTAPEKVKSRVRAHATLLGEVVRALQTCFRFPKYNVPTISATSPEEIEEAANECRHIWGLGTDAPILHVGRVLEHAGVPIATGTVDVEKVFAFSRKGATTLIFLNQVFQSPSHWAFDIGHECGHLVLHAGVQTGDKKTETEADRFSSAFLLPDAAFRREFGSSRRISWPHLFEMKRRWRVSLSAIVKRAYDLKLLDGLQYRHAYQYMAMKKWLKGEPHEPNFQGPELIGPALDGLGRTVSLTASELCDRLCFSPETFQEVTGKSIKTQSKSSGQVLEFRSPQTRPTNSGNNNRQAHNNEDLLPKRK